MLRHRPDLPKGERRSAGLFHTALLHPDAGDRWPPCWRRWRPALRSCTPAAATTWCRRRSTSTTRRATASSCTSTDRATSGRGTATRCTMDTLCLDPNAFLAEHLTDAARDFLETAPDRRPALAGSEAQVVGHVHLKVGQTANGQGLLRRHPRLRRDRRAARRPVRLRRRLPPPHGDEHLGVAPASACVRPASASARCRSRCRPSTTCWTPPADCAVAAWRLRSTPGRTGPR